MRQPGKCSSLLRLQRAFGSLFQRAKPQCRRCKLESCKYGIAIAGGNDAETLNLSSSKLQATAIKKLDFAVTAKNAKALGKKGPKKVDGIGASSADKMYEFLTTGTMQKLEEKRANAL